MESDGVRHGPPPFPCASNQRIVKSEELLQPLESPAFAFFASCDISLIVRAVISSTNDSKSSHDAPSAAPGAVRDDVPVVRRHCRVGGRERVDAPLASRREIMIADAGGAPVGQ